MKGWFNRFRTGIHGGIRVLSFVIIVIIGSNLVGCTEMIKAQGQPAAAVPEFSSADLDAHLVAVFTADPSKLAEGWARIGAMSASQYVREVAALERDHPLRIDGTEYAGNKDRFAQYLRANLQAAASYGSMSQLWQQIKFDPKEFTAELMAKIHAAAAGAIHGQGSLNLTMIQPPRLKFTDPKCRSTVAFFGAKAVGDLFSWWQSTWEGLQLDAAMTERVEMLFATHSEIRPEYEDSVYPTYAFLNNCIANPPAIATLQQGDR